MTNRNDPCWCGSGKKYKKCHLFDDLEKGKQTPAHHRAPKKVPLKNQHEIQAMRRAGAFNGELLDYIKPFVKVGITTEEIDRLVSEYTNRHGHKAACLGYRGFPKSVCTSINNVVCHGIPSVRDVLKDGDIVNIDLTTIVEGFYGDSSETIMIGSVSEKARHLVMVAAEALIRGIDAIKPGLPLQAIAQAIDPYVTSQGCSVVKQFTGHGIGKKFHEHFSVYHHIDDEAEHVIMEPGMTLTVEPMINLGGWEVTVDSIDRWTVRTSDGSLSAQFEHTMLVTENGVEVLTLTPTQRAAGIRLAVGKRRFS
jgi:methionyl aminopeptidase